MGAVSLLPILTLCSYFLFPVLVPIFLFLVLITFLVNAWNYSFFFSVFGYQRVMCSIKIETKKKIFKPRLKLSHSRCRLLKQTLLVVIRGCEL